MRIKVNGCELDTLPAITVQALLKQLGYEDNFVAVAVNATCIARRSFNEHALHERDEIEVLAPMAGG